MQRTQEPSRQSVAQQIGEQGQWADALEPEPRKEFLRVLRDVSAESGYGPAVEAAARIVELGNAPDRASVTVLASGICNGRGIVDYADPVDMSDYDAAFAAIGGDSHDEQV